MILHRNSGSNTGSNRLAAINAIVKLTAENWQFGCTDAFGDSDTRLLSCLYAFLLKLGHMLELTDLAIKVT